MKHLGDITQIKGSCVPLVDIVTGGSPCQDLSIAGQRKGLAGERSGLFMEQIRIIKEMRDECERRLYDAGADYNRTDIKPQYMVWENVSGAFSSNKGEDFRAVLEETAKVADKDAYVPGLEGGQKWSPTGCILGNGWSIAWRLHDAQYWGVPQRRKRICLLADFNGDTAGKVLFELQRETIKSDSEQAIVDIGTESRSEVQSVSKGLSGDIAQSGKEGERVAEDTERCAGEASYTLKIRGGADTYRKPDGSIGTAGKGPLVQTELSATLGVSQDQTLITVEPGAMSRVGGHAYEDVAGTVRANAGDNKQAVVYGIGSYDSNAMKSDNPKSGIYQADTSRTLDLNGGNPGCNQGGMAVVSVQSAMAMQAIGEYKQSEAASSLKMRDYKDATDLIVSYGLDRASFNQGMNAQYDFAVDEEKIGTQVAKGPAAVASFYPQMKAESQCWREDDVSNTLVNGTNPGYQNGVCTSVVRRLTPLECERLQGFPDNWTNIGDWVDSKGKTHKGESDSPRYKALGNSIALPYWSWMAERMMPYLPENPTMASLFDGIGGFPLVFSRCGCEPIWASEIEEFPIAVTKIRFPEED